MQRAAAALCGVLLIASVVPLSAQSTGDTYTGCLNVAGKAKGKIVKVREGNEPLAPCTSKQIQISWNQMGPEGENGADGQDGAPGADGADGPPGIAGNVALADQGCALDGFVVGFDGSGDIVCSTLPPPPVFGPDVLFVSATDPNARDDASCGSLLIGSDGTALPPNSSNYPCLTIGRGQSNALSKSRAVVAVAEGTYAEQVTLVNGLRLLGGYRQDFRRRGIQGDVDTARFDTVIEAPSSAVTHNIAVRASSITSATVFEGFEVVAPTPPAGSGLHSIGIYVSNSDEDLVVRKNVIRGGTAGDGVNGVDGPSGGPGPDGANGSNASNFTSTPQPITGGAGGGGSGFLGAGGAGGTAAPPQAPPHQQSAASGTLGGAGGHDSERRNVGGGTCGDVTVSGERRGQDGHPGSNGADGGRGLGGTTSSTVAGGHWVPADGGVGFQGENGGGGGGGGPAGGVWDVNDCESGAIEHRTGASGGGGGAGGEGGFGGGGGSGGGGSFGIFVHSITSSSSRPIVESNVIERGVGGDGGVGGNAGLGGRGGFGGLGGADTFWVGGHVGGDGGTGGRGGHGGGAGGGGGGPSIGIVESNYTGASPYGVQNTISGGRAGVGGKGGFPAPGNVGSPGDFAAALDV